MLSSDRGLLEGHGRYTVRRVERRDETGNPTVVEAADNQRGGRLVSIKLIPCNVPPQDHPHLVKLSDVFKWGDRLCVAMDNMNEGSLKDFMIGHGGGPLDELTARFYFQQLVYAVEYCHRTGYAVNEITMDNLQVVPPSLEGADRPTLKLVHYGSAVNVLLNGMAR